MGFLQHVDDELHLDLFWILLLGPLGTLDLLEKNKFIEIKFIILCLMGL